MIINLKQSRILYYDRRVNENKSTHSTCSNLYKMYRNYKYTQNEYKYSIHIKVMLEINSILTVQY